MESLIFSTQKYRNNPKKSGCYGTASVADWDLRTGRNVNMNIHIFDRSVADWDLQHSIQRDLRRFSTVRGISTSTSSNKSILATLPPAQLALARMG